MDASNTSETYNVVPLNTGPTVPAVVTPRGCFLFQGERLNRVWVRGSSNAFLVYSHMCSMRQGLSESHCP